MVKVCGRTVVTAPTMAHSRGRQIGADGWQAALLPHLMGLSIGLPVYPYNMVAGFSIQESEAKAMSFLT